MLCDRDEFIVETATDTDSAYGEFLRMYYDTREISPRITVDRDFGDRELTEQIFSEKIGKKVTIAVPLKGEQLHLAEMCRSNAYETLASRDGMHGRSAEALSELAQLLGLPSSPQYIEAYDISNTAGSENVGAMVTFKDGEPYKNGYRLFKIKGFSGQDDYRSMAEVIERRMNEYLKAEDHSRGFGRLPDLILLDGGAGQLSAVQAVLDRMGISVPVFGMVKDSKHKTRAISANGGEIAVKSNRRVYSLIYSVQEEVHRFVIGFHRKRRSGSITTELLKIDGVGQVTAQKLLSHFKSLKTVKNAELDNLKNLNFISDRVAENIYNYYNSEDQG